MDYKQYSSANRRQHILATYLSFRQKDQSSQVRYTMISARNGWSKGKQEEEQRRESKQDLCYRTNTGRGYEWEWATLAPDGRAPKSRGKLRSFSKLWLWWWRLQQQIQQSIAASRESEAMWPSVYIELLLEDRSAPGKTTHNNNEAAKDAADDDVSSFPHENSRNKNYDYHNFVFFLLHLFFSILFVYAFFACKTAGATKSANNNKLILPCSTGQRTLSFNFSMKASKSGYLSCTVIRWCGHGGVCKFSKGWLYAEIWDSWVKQLEEQTTSDSECWLLAAVFVRRKVLSPKSGIGAFR